MKRQVEGKCHKIENDSGTWMAVGVVEAQKTHFEAFKVTIKQNTSGLDSRLKGLKWELSSTVSESVLLTGCLKELLESLGDGANLEGQVETGPADKVEMKSPGAGNPAGPTVRSP